MKSVVKILLMFVMFFTTFVCARENRGTYVGDLNAAAVWINPKDIKVHIIPSGKKDNILVKAFNIWNESLRGKIRFNFIGNQEDADITIEYKDKLEGNQLGVTYPRYINIQGKTCLYKTRVIISRTDQYGFIIQDADLRRTALHEIAHAIGVIGHSTHISDIMYPTTASAQTTPSTRDVETVRRIYGF